MEERKLALNKRVSLAGIADGWDDQAFVVFRPAQVKQIKMIAKASKGVDVRAAKEGELKGDVEDTFDVMLSVAKELFKFGKVYAGDMQLVNMVVNDLDEIFGADLERFVDNLFGGTADPKSPKESEA